MNATQFRNKLFDYTRFAFDNEKRVIDHFFPDSKYTSLEEFYMSGSVCRIMLSKNIHTEKMDWVCEFIPTDYYLEWADEWMKKML